MSDAPDKAQYEEWARKAHDLAGKATTDTARALHLAIAEEYDTKAANCLAPRDSSTE